MQVHQWTGLRPSQRLRLVLDLEDGADVAFLWWLVRTQKPRHIHAWPPCTFWGHLGRSTARRAENDWQHPRA